MTSLLDGLIDDQETAHTQKLDAVSQGEDAKKQLLRIEQYLEELAAVRALRDKTIERSTSQLSATQAEASAYPGSSEYKSAVAATTQFDESLTNALDNFEISVVAGKTKFADYVGALLEAQDDLDKGALRVAQARLALDHARKGVELRARVTSTAIAPVARWVGDAKASVADSIRKSASSDGAGAWWALEKADATLKRIADSTTAYEAVKDAFVAACEAFATAVQELIDADTALPALVTARDDAAANLQLAEAQVLKALADALTE